MFHGGLPPVEKTYYNEKPVTSETMRSLKWGLPFALYRFDRESRRAYILAPVEGTLGRPTGLQGGTGL
jgi:hypothetical protein